MENVEAPPLAGPNNTKTSFKVQIVEQYIVCAIRHLCYQL